LAGTKRLSELDGLRAVAALSVVFYHYFSRWDDVLPYGSAVQPAARFGALGVNLFFIISGFVIFMSLERCASASVFAKRRALRLLPAMLVCSVITFIAMRLIDTPFANIRREPLSGFLPSWTFTPPQIWKMFVPVGGWMDGVYWTLYIEMKFYIIAAALYFFKGHRFFRVGFLALLVLGTIASRAFASHPSIGLLIEHGLFPVYLPFFCAGMALYEIHERRRGAVSSGMLTLSILLAIAAMPDVISGAIAGTFFAIFFVVIFRRAWVAWLSHPALAAVGVASYPLYLVHQNVGVAVMSMVSPQVMRSWFYLVVVGTIAALVLLSLAIHSWVEHPVESYFKRKREGGSLARFHPHWL
jgi:peptidoglycan/LPS O-acetylase OafA/YrhL